MLTFVMNFKQQVMKPLHTTITTLMMGMAMYCTLPSCNRAKTDKDMEQHNHSHEAAETVYSCPMHPEVTGSKGDTCPKCGMALEPQTANGDHKMTFSHSPNPIEAGKPTQLSLAFSNGDTPAELETVHEEPIHLLAVSEDLSWFRHIHPKPQGNAYIVSLAFPHGGDYLLYADYKPKGRQAAVEKIPVEVKGARKQPVSWDKPKLTSEADGYRVELVNAREITTGRETTLNISISKNGRAYKAEDLGLYLGAAAHIIVIGTTDKDLVHIHPGTGTDFPLTAHVTLDKPDLYRMWVQFNIDNKLITADFAIKATGSAGTAAPHGSHSHHH